jgi:hypothetical protein
VTRRVIVRYRVKPDQAERNEELVRAVYEDLHRANPAGLRYATFRLEDGVTFVHVAEGDGSVLGTLETFQACLADITERCDEPPVAMQASEVGSFGR